MTFGSPPAGPSRAFGPARADRSAAPPASQHRQALVACWALGLTALVLAPIWFGRGFVLSYDMVAVPAQGLQPWMWGGSGGPPRAVPQDVYVAALDNLVPGAVLQRALLSLVMLGAMSGVAALLRPAGGIAQAAGMSAYAWSAYFYERLVIGHWGLLLACAALPWAVLAAMRVREGRRAAAGWLVLVVLAGTWVPTGGALLVLVAAAIVLWPGGPASAPLRAGALLGSMMVQATWLVPALLAAREGTPSSGVFGLRPDDVVGAVLAALGGTGIWNQSTAPGSREGALGVAAVVVVLAVAAAGARPLAARALGPDVLAPLALVSGILLVWAVATALPGLAGLVTAVERIPGGGLFRDGQKWLAPWWLTVSLAFGAAAGRLSHRGRADRARVALGGVVAIVPLVLLPDLAWAALGRLTPAQYPGDWDRVAATLDRQDDGSAVVSLPWSTFRRYAWNADRVVLDPAPRYLPREVVADSTLLVGSGPAVVASDDPRVPSVEAGLRAEDPGAALRALGVGWVVLQRDQPTGQRGEQVADVTDLAGATVAWDGPWLTLVRLGGEVGPTDPPAHLPAVLAGWLTALVAGGAAAGTAARWRKDPRRGPHDPV